VHDMAVGQKPPGEVKTYEARGPGDQESHGVDWVPRLAQPAQTLRQGRRTCHADVLAGS
jgi:hypothetical protein